MSLILELDGPQVLPNNGGGVRELLASKVVLLAGLLPMI